MEASPPTSHPVGNLLASLFCYKHDMLCCQRDDKKPNVVLSTAILHLQLLRTILEETHVLSATNYEHHS